MGADQSKPQTPPKGGKKSTKSPRTQGNGKLTEEERKKYYDGPNQIQLAYSVLGGMPGMQAYHTSVVINGTEFFFQDSGIESSSSFESHRQPEQGGDSTKTANNQSTELDQGGGMRRGPPKYTLMDFGGSKKSSQEMISALSQFFRSGTYDLLRKNCNSFSDAAIWFLTGQRIPSQFRQLEQMGSSWGGSMLKSQMGYEPNKQADDFDLEKVIDKYDIGKMWSTPGHTLGGGSKTDGKGGADKPLSAAEMRAKRLEALERQEREAKAAAEKKAAA